MEVLSIYKDKRFGGTSLNIKLEYHLNHHHEKLHCDVTIGGYVKEGKENYFMFSAGYGTIKDVLIDALMCVQKQF